jgi:hypothetical protein
LVRTIVLSVLLDCVFLPVWERAIVRSFKRYTCLSFLPRSVSFESGTWSGGGEAEGYSTPCHSFENEPVFILLFNSSKTDLYLFFFRLFENGSASILGSVRKRIYIYSSFNSSKTDLYLFFFSTLRQRICIYSFFSTLRQRICIYSSFSTLLGSFFGWLFFIAQPLTLTLILNLTRPSPSPSL